MDGGDVSKEDELTWRTQAFLRKYITDFFTTTSILFEPEDQKVTIEAPDRGIESERRDAVFMKGEKEAEVEGGDKRRGSRKEGRRMEIAEKRKDVKRVEGGGGGRERRRVVCLSFEPKGSEECEGRGCVGDFSDRFSSSLTKNPSFFPRSSFISADREKDTQTRELYDSVMRIEPYRDLLMEFLTEKEGDWPAKLIEEIDQLLVKNNFGA